MEDRISETLRMALLNFAQTTMDRRPDFVIGGYLERWHLGSYGAMPNAYIHRFLGDDSDRALHDHPYDNVSVVLSGGYIEHVHEEPFKVVDEKYATVPTHRKSGEVIKRIATVAHRISLIQHKPAVSLFLCGTRFREWGFITPSGWIHFREFEKGNV